MSEPKDGVVGVEVADLTPTDIVAEAERRRIELEIRLQNEVREKRWRERKQGGNGDE
jgi:hypothetical protein